MTLKPGITVHCIVKNEERFVWYALNSVIPFVEEVLVFDTGSTDNTPKIIKSIQDSKLIFEEKGPVNKTDFYSLRQEQIYRTKTKWFLVVDGDEIWPHKAIQDFVQLTKSTEKSIIVVPFNNFLQDIYHFQDELEGGYTIANKRGNLTIRGIRTDLEGLHVEGDYGIEGYYDAAKQPIQNRISDICFLQAPYLHASNLIRSSSILGDWKIGYRRQKIFVGKKMVTIQEPELSEIRKIFSTPVPLIGYSPLRISYASTLLRNVIIKPIIRGYGFAKSYLYSRS